MAQTIFQRRGDKTVARFDSCGVRVVARERAHDTVYSMLSRNSDRHFSTKKAAMSAAKRFCNANKNKRRKKRGLASCGCQG